MATPAVVVERACKYYGRKDSNDYKPVLQNLDMTVEKGIIYGLLGASGCGKTTLLSCIVGRRKLDSGEVWVLGGRPGEKGSGVPGPRVGYMPQDIALVAEFTIRDAIYYFGRIYGMKTEQLHDRFKFLSDLLELPSPGRFIKQLSGGQQRRVSLAAALVHDPELLILDEPTVGLDPMLREKIWNYLSELATKGTTVIITTHYIDETKQAHKIGLLRDGQLLAQDAPDEILRRYSCTTLEEAFLKMAVAQNENLRTNRRRSTLTSSSPDVIPDNTLSNDSRFHSTEDFSIVTSSRDVLTKKDNHMELKSKKKGRYKAVFIKSIQQFSRHPGGLIFSALFPIIQVVAFFSAVGHDPKDLHLAIVNDEAASVPMGLDLCRNDNLTRVMINEDGSCDYFMLSCWFLDEMEKRNLMVSYYNNTHEAKAAVASLKTYGAIYFPANFSHSLALRVADGYVEDDIVEDGTISVWLDMTDHQISNYLKRQLHKTYEYFTKRTMNACGLNEDLVQIPVRFKTPIFGSLEPEMVSYMAPGIMVTIIYFLPAIVTSTLMISDRLEGVWERSAVAGVQPREMLHVHIALQAAVIVMQTIEMMALAFMGYSLPFKGSFLTCGILLFLQGVGGMCYGFLLSVLCPSYTLSFFVATGSFYPMVLLCGILWPLEAMPIGLRYIAIALPFTIPSKTLRDLMEKGSSITEFNVYFGFIVTILWIGISLSICFLKLKYKKT
ncbi:ABC transporter G family member 20-like [Zerene cesonia]|uniref:ABC transporter G family member 20-like n=1 Tax=Zerene cesonia TaxID=33412 RepID=UPI0018E4E652|nr:ABC transporter G family member 20-like [Zerene cesonia]